MKVSNHSRTAQSDTDTEGGLEAQGCAEDATAVIAGLKNFGVLYQLA